MSVALLTSNINTGAVNAQTIDLVQVPNTNSPVPQNLQPQDITPSTPSPLQIPQPSKPQQDVLPDIPSPFEIPEVNLENCPAKITVTEFQVIAKHPVFSKETLDAAVNTEQFLNQPLSCAELLRSALEITQIYHDAKYQTSGAKVVIPKETQENNHIGIVKIEVIEGELEAIKVIPFCPKNQQNINSDSDCPTTTKPLHLNPEYVRSRLALAKSIPFNIGRLEEALQLLRLNAPIENIFATLSAGSKPGNTILEVQIKEGNTSNIPFSINNSRSPSSGSFQRRIGLSDNNFLGMGDSLSWNYNNTDGSNGWDMSYTLPFNPRNGTLNFSYSNTSSNVIEAPFNELDINSQSRAYELTLRQPIIQSIKEQTFQEFTLGLTASRKESETSLLGTPFPLSPGADEQGRTRISALRFFQEWSQQNSTGVIAVRSQFNLGIGAFDTTINQPISEVNEVIPDNRFFSWQGQGQWVQLIAPETVLLLRTNMQLAVRTLVPLEQFAIGGFGSVRGYRQDTLLSDNGIFTSAELQLPILRIPNWKSVFQLTPFLDYGTAWNSSGRENSNPNSLASVGLGLKLRQGDNFTARLDWGIPLIYVNSRERTWQENGLTFTLLWNPF
ncbi:ShlB/FhaC/HecB family hemolysin secretion/activation protein [Nodularia sp. UHCC 0506]|uniref:ShlB/FhaC/HecB family hemolysin secretion/activation protein n=1 Tax=Nodularia sp. UHCC 0506 TaxID=3110243 RepID=UPI002B1F545B|nr:ShlB/FhaC/HecB family hemolysin secretion/activation protein [Nodularia sp. UHCC 0506]MEA5516758.1 ShlB/FhaC/HecB family hemolysin secretion/activation protein [Nodularia sp. UHCC 0506]